MRVSRWLNRLINDTRRRRDPIGKRRNMLRGKVGGTPTEQLEERLLLTVDSLADQPLPVGLAPVDVTTGLFDSNSADDLITLNTDGSLTIALNAGNDLWESVQTVSSGTSAGVGLTSSLFDADPFGDLAVQGPDSISILTADGVGGLILQQSLTATVPGAFASASGRVQMDASLLNDDLFADLVTVSPGTNEVQLFAGRGDGQFSASPQVFASGGDEPVAVLAGDFLGNGANDLAVGHSDGTVTFFEGDGAGNFSLTAGATVSGLGTVSRLTAGDFGGNDELDLAVTAGDDVFLLLNDTDTLTTSPIVNGTFSQGLSGWTTQIVGHALGNQPGHISGVNGFAQFTENDSFLTSLQQAFVVPPNPQSLTVDLISLGLELPNGGVPDAFEISLLNGGSNSLVPTFRADATSFLNVNPGGQLSTAAGVTFDGTTVTLDISAIAAGTEATLIFDLVGNPPGSESTVVIDNVSVTPDLITTDSFTVTSLTGPFTNATGLDAADVDGDGNVDIVVGDGGAGRVAVFNGDGTGGFIRTDTDVSAFGTSPTSITTGLLTSGDTIADLAIGVFDANLVLTPLARDSTAPTATLLSPQSGSTTADSVTQFTVLFDKSVRDTGPGGVNSVTNPAAYSLVEAGPNGVFGDGDDIVVPITGIQYEATHRGSNPSATPPYLMLSVREAGRCGDVA